MSDVSTIEATRVFLRSFRFFSRTSALSSPKVLPSRLRVDAVLAWFIPDGRDPSPLPLPWTPCLEYVPSRFDASSCPTLSCDPSFLRCPSLRGGLAASLADATNPCSLAAQASPGPSPGPSSPCPPVEADAPPAAGPPPMPPASSSGWTLPPPRPIIVTRDVVAKSRTESEVRGPR